MPIESLAPVFGSRYLSKSLLSEDLEEELAGAEEEV